MSAAAKAKNKAEEAKGKAEEAKGKAEATGEAVGHERLEAGARPARPRPACSRPARRSRTPPRA